MVPGPSPAGLAELEQLFGNLISVVVGIAFIVLVVMLVFAGIRYITSSGEPKSVQQAHLTITWALLGILFLAISWLLLLLIQAFTGIEVTVFNIRSLCGVAGQFCTPQPSPAGI